MAADKTPKSTLDALKALHELLTEPAEDPATIPIERVRKELAREGIDTAPLIRNVRQQIAEARAHLLLEAARQKRERLLQSSAKGPRPSEGLREQIQALLASLGGRQPALAGVYFRKLEQATDADLRGLYEDLARLEEMTEENGDDI